MTTGKKVSFKPPMGAVPEGTAEGDTFDLVSTFLLEPGGTVCLKVMGETPMPGYGGADKTAPKPSYRDEASAMTASAPAPTEGNDNGY
jgi:hypothetical protein